MEAKADDLLTAIESTVYRILYNEVSTFFPAEITKVNREGGYVTVDCESCFLRVDDSTGKDLTYSKKIQDVPLMLPQNGGFILRPPLDDECLVGETVGLHISNNYLANWKNTGGKVLPTLGRKFHIADAVAQFGLYPSNKVWDVKQEAKTAEFQVKKGYKIGIGDGENELLKMFHQTLTTFDELLTKLQGPVDKPSTSSTGTLIEIMGDLVQFQTDNKAVLTSLEKITNV